jgi:phosphatidylglycerol---prolipoprotein diacylglyceryl transferase
MEFYIDPILVSIGFIHVRYYGLVYALGFLGLYYFLISKKVLTDAQASSFIVHCGVGMLIFARLFHILFDNFAYYAARPIEVFYIWQGGLAFFGGFIGLVVGAYWFLRKRKNSKHKFFILADYTVLVGSITLVFGRLANLINQELVGRVTTVAQTPWCFYFIESMSATGPVFESVCRHPYQLYASFSHLLMFIILLVVLIMVRRFEERHNLVTYSYAGIVFLSFMCVYSLFRFITDFWRDDIILAGLTHWQWVSLVIFVLSVVFLYLYLKLKPFVELQKIKHKSKR